MRRIPKRIVYVLIIVLVWLSFIVQGSRALLNDQASLTDNTITSATLDLVINTSQTAAPSSFASSQRGFSYTMLPGQSDTRYIFLKNQSEGSVGMDISVMPVIKGDLPQDAMDGIVLEFAITDTTGVPTGQVIAGSLSELSATYTRLNSLIVPGGVQRFIVKTSMLESFSYSNQTVAYDIQFVGTQML